VDDDLSRPLADKIPPFVEHAEAVEVVMDDHNNVDIDLQLPRMTPQLPLLLRHTYLNSNMDVE
jgi:hypothetical protein